ncbi:MAG: hypothetical protein GX442_20975 [Candidatus Riflebacteria bacterium]|nr:hypothetical protein [Candidatus Riflebacteria bacterium]
MRCEIAGATRPAGGAGAVNEDAFLTGTAPFPWGAVADGAGRAGGSARRALDLFRRLLVATPVDSLADPATWAAFAGPLDSHLIGLEETTFLAAGLVGDRFLGVWCGDSRAYRLGPAGEAALVTAGSRGARLGSGRARGSPFTAPAAPGMCLLLLTDGAWTPFELPARLQAVVAALPATRPADLPDALLTAAARTGHADDMTAVAFHLRDKSAPIPFL